MLFPLRVEDATVDRVPWVSLGIAALCALAFLATWVLPKNPEGIDAQAAHEILQYYEQHPYLKLSDQFTGEFMRPSARKALEAMREEPPADLDQATRDSEQKHLDELEDEFEAQAKASLLRRLSLVPARGFSQPGWLTAMFLHFGWMHILGNLFFFYLTGPLLEDLWGRAFFGGFYLVGGVVAALAHFAIDPHSTTMMAGASGAIAACMGAFTFRCANRKIRMAYFWWFRRGTFLMPAWAWGGLWFAGEVLSLVTHSSGGVAVMAHVGGFLFGFGTAVLLSRTGYEAQNLAPKVAAATVWEQHQGIDEARAALDRGDGVAAANAYRGVVRERPDDREALVGLARLEQEPARVEPLIQKLLAAGDKDGAWDIVIALGPVFDPEKIGEKTAWALGGAADAAPQGLLQMSDRLDLAVGRRGGPLAAKALVRLSRRCHAQGRDDEAREYAGMARELPGLQPEMRQSIEAVAVDLGLPPPAAPPAPPAAPPPFAPSAVRVLPCKLVQMSDEVLHVTSQAGQPRTVELDKLAGIGAGIVKTATGASIVTDLILSFGDAGQAPAAIRIEGAQLGLPVLYPGMPAKDAYALFLTRVLAHTAATPLPDKSSLLRGDYPRFDSIAALNAAFYKRQA